MKITEIKTYLLRQPGAIQMIGDGSQDTILVKVETDTGLCGWGESDSSPDVVNAIIHTPPSHIVCRGLKEIVVGQDPFDVEKIWQDMYAGSYYYGRRGVGLHAMSAIDMAIWDIIGKAVGLPIHKLLGGCFHRNIPAYASMLMPETEEEVREKVKIYLARGFRNIKFGWGALGQSKEKDIRLVAAAREAIGPNKNLMLDVGFVWHNSKYAASMCKALEPYNLYWVEEPLVADDVAGYAKLSNQTSTPIAGGETLAGIHEFKNLIEQGHVDIIQPDISRCGGFSVARKLSDMALLNGIEMVPHAFKSGLLMAASLQVIAAYRGKPLLEYCSQETVLSKSLLENHFQLEEDGTVTVPNSPGLGIKVNEQAVQKFCVGGIH